MRWTIVLAAVLLLGAFATAQDAKPDDAPARARAALESADPFAPDSKSAGLVTPDAADEAAIRELARSAPETTVRDRAAHLALAWDLAATVRAGNAKPDLAYWLALDELDREYAGAPRDALLVRALPDAETRTAALKSLADARETARRFCLDWNELRVPDSEQAKAYEALESAIEKAGAAAVPYLFGVLAVPPQATFSVMKPERGVTARQEVRALFALGFLKTKEAVPYLVFQCRGPSFTASTTAQGELKQLTGVDFGSNDAEEPARVAAIDAWWGQHRDEHALVLDHFVRHELRWTRAALTSGDRETEYWSQFGPSGLERVLGRTLGFEPDAEIAGRTAQIDAIERDWLAQRQVPPPISPPRIEWDWPSVLGDDGKSRFQITAIVRHESSPPGGNETLEIHGQFETDETDTLLSNESARLTVTPEGGPERSFGQDGGKIASVGGRAFTAVGLDLGPLPKRLTSLEFELRLVHVKSWTTDQVEELRNGDLKKVVLPPMQFSIEGKDGFVRVSRSSTRAPNGGAKEKRDLVSLAWSASTIDVIDADGEPLAPWSGVMSGGFIATMYGPPEHSNAVLAYPVTITVRVPATWDDRTVRYRFTDLDLSKVPAPPR